jgi:hypothetical protein
MQPAEWSGGISDIEGKATRGGESERGQRASFNPVDGCPNSGRSEALRHDVAKKILLIVGICLALAVGAVGCLFVAFFVSMERGEKHQRQIRKEQRSGKWDFGDQPALFAVAQAIVKNDQDAIRVGAKALPDLQTPGHDGTTLLYFAVTQSWQRPELVEAVRTLLSLGADPNYTNGKRDSFVMANAVHASAPVLRAMLEAAEIRTLATSSVGR